MSLPEGVERVRAKGRTYYYWNPGRGTVAQGKRERLPDPETHSKQFWREIERLQARPTPTHVPGTVGFMIAQYRDSDEFKRNSESTQTSYNIHLDRFIAGWGDLQGDEVTTAGAIAARDNMRATPGMANHMLSCGRTLWAWGIPRGHATKNPFVGVEPIETADVGHIPWPRWASDYVTKHAWPDMARLVELGIATCQRESDLIRMGPEQREDRGLWCRPKKTRRKRKAFCIPLSTAQAFMLDRWAETPITFTAARWKQPIKRHRADLYLYSPKGAAYSETSLRARWHRWLKNTDEGKTLVKRWKEWVAIQVRRYEWDIDPELSSYPTIHGLRGAGILLRFAEGFSVDQIANDVGMSRAMVERYMRFRDQVEIAKLGRLRLVGEG